MEVTNEIIEQIKKDIKDILTDDRYKHSLGVMERAEELAKIYNVDINKAKAVGLAHDIAKEMPVDEALQYIKDNNIEIDEVERINFGLLHGKIGADIVKKKYDFPKDMQNAILFHTMTDPNMDILAKIVYVADKTEKNRKSDEYDIEYERNLSNVDIDKAILLIINENIKSLLKKDKLIHPKAIETRNSIIINNINSK